LNFAGVVKLRLSHELTAGVLSRQLIFDAGAKSALSRAACRLLDLPEISFALDAPVFTA
jgi:hypothetical protein